MIPKNPGIAEKVMTFQAMLENLRGYLAYIAVVCMLSDCLETDMKFSKMPISKGYNNWSWCSSMIQ